MSVRPSGQDQREDQRGAHSAASSAQRAENRASALSPDHHRIPPTGYSPQKPLDLLPESVRLRCQAGLRTGRYIAAVVAGLVLVVLATTHSRFELERRNNEYAEAREKADQLLQIEQRKIELLADLEQAERAIELHDRLALPLRISALLSTISNRIPASVTLDRLDLSAGHRTAARGRSTGSDADAQRRMLRGELTGFATSDEEIAEVIGALRATPPLEDVTPDFSRTRTVRGRSAREFRISFRVNLDAAYEGKSQVAAGGGVFDE